MVVVLRLMSSFAFIQHELLHKTVQKINEKSFQRSTGEICRHLFYLNFSDEKLSQAFLANLGKARRSFYYLIYVCSLNLPNEAELVESFFEALKEPGSQETGKKIFLSKSELHRLLRFLEVFYPEKQYVGQLSELLGQERIEDAVKLEAERRREIKFIADVKNKTKNKKKGQGYKQNKKEKMRGRRGERGEGNGEEEEGREGGGGGGGRIYLVRRKLN